MAKIKFHSTILILLAAFIAASTFIFIPLNTVYLGIDVKKDVDGKWTIINADRQRWSIEHDIRLGDELLEINGQDPLHHPSMKFNSVEQVESLLLQRGDQQFSVDIQDMHTTEVNESNLAPTLLFCMVYLFSVFLYIKKRNDSSATLLVLFFLTLSLCYMASWASSVRISYAQVFVISSLPLVPILFLHFIYDYFKKLSIYILSPRVLYVFYAAIFFVLLLELIYTYTDFGYLFSHVWLSATSLLLFTLGCSLMIYILIAGYVKHRRTIYNPLFKYMIIGNLVSFSPFILLYALPQMLFHFKIVSAYVAAMSLLLSPLVYVYLIVSKKLMDISFIIDRLRYECKAAIIPSLIIPVILASIAGLQVFSLEGWLQFIVLVYIASVLFLYLKGSVELKTKRLSFGYKMTYQHSLNRFTEEIAKVSRQEMLEAKIVDEICSVLPVEFAAIVEMDHRTQQLTVHISQGNVPDQSLQSPPDCSKLASRIGDMIDDDDTGLWMLIGKKQLSYCLLWLGHKKNRIQFNPDELVWMKTIANYVGIVYENLDMMSGMISEIDSRGDMRSPTWVSRLLFLLSEKERRRLASDLHDSALQDQLLWYRKFTEVMTDYELPADMSQRMTEIKEGMLDVVHQIRETCNELRPPFLREIGAAEAMNQLCNYAALNANFSVDFDHHNFNLHLNDEYVLTLYRITQELLRNTMKHAYATEVKLTLHNEGANIRYCYSDNGIGMDLLRMKSSFRHMGLSGVRERVSGLNGETEFRSEEGCGFEVIVTLPYREAMQVSV